VTESTLKQHFLLIFRGLYSEFDENWMRYDCFLMCYLFVFEVVEGVCTQGDIRGIMLRVICYWFEMKDSFMKQRAIVFIAFSQFLTCNSVEPTQRNTLLSPFQCFLDLFGLSLYTLYFIATHYANN
jgi:hypothetical protein